MFPPDESQPEPDDRPIHIDFIRWIFEYTQGDISAAQLVSIMRALIVQMRQAFTNAEISALFGQSLVVAERYLEKAKFQGGVIDIETGELKQPALAEDRRNSDLYLWLDEDVPDDISELLDDDEEADRD